jgi:two-component system response regulator FixJ
MSERSLIYVVDDDEAMRDSLAFLLGSSGFEVKCFDSAVSFLEALPNLDVTCVVTDVRMPEVDGIELMRRLKASGRRWPVIVMTGHGDVPLAVEAMKLGAFDFLEKPFEDEVLMSTIKSAIQQNHATAEAEDDMKDVVVRIESLTPRERQVMERLVAGQANKVIGRDLGVSPRTVEIYRANVMTKMQASSISELVRLAIRGGMA